VRDAFARSVEEAGGRVHRGEGAVEHLLGQGVSVTGCLCAIADTGTIVLSSRLTGGRRAGLVDAVHVVLVRDDQLVPDLAAALERVTLETTAASAVTFVTGPSRTADIEGVLVRGAHGPRELHVVLV
jgi:L-lactate dehydrogenase complex protein LldG